MIPGEVLSGSRKGKGRMILFSHEMGVALSFDELLLNQPSAGIRHLFSRKESQKVGLLATVSDRALIGRKSAREEE